MPKYHCPFCADHYVTTVVELNSEDDRLNTVYVLCTGCGARGPHIKGSSDAAITAAQRLWEIRITSDAVKLQADANARAKKAHNN